jgi:hypothetical protein
MKNKFYTYIKPQDQLLRKSCWRSLNSRKTERQKAAEEEHVIENGNVIEKGG